MQKKKYPPHVWRQGTPEQQLKLRFLRARCQARYRSETWALTWEEYQDLWKLRPSNNTGRSRGAFNLARINHTSAWKSGNVEWIERGIATTRRDSQNQTSQQRRDSRKEICK